MIIEIDDIKMTLKIKEDSNVADLIKKLDEMLPDNKWKGYKLEVE